MLRQRLFGILAGYEDCNDHDTLRSEPVFLSPTYRGNPELEFQQFRDLGVDGIFTDFPDVAVRALRPTATSK